VVHCRHCAAPSSVVKSALWSFRDMDSVEDDLLFAMLLVKRLRRRQQRRPRRWWVHPILSSRAEKGLFNTLYDDLREHEEKFIMYFRMSKNTFDELLSYVEDKLRKEDTVMRKCIPPDERLALFLR